MATVKNSRAEACRATSVTDAPEATLGDRRFGTLQGRHMKLQTTCDHS